jgi:hypothetical protein
MSYECQEVGVDESDGLLSEYKSVMKVRHFFSTKADSWYRLLRLRDEMSEMM